MEALFERAIFFLERERFQEAEEQLRNILGQDPQNPRALGLMAQVLIRLDKREEALEAAQAAVAAAPDQPMNYYSLAWTQFFVKKMDEAWATTEEGLKLAPLWDSFFLIRVQIAFYREEWTLALEQSEQGLARNPENTALVNYRAQALIKLNRKAEAAQTMEYALNREPDNAQSHSNKGWIQIEQGKMDEAIETFSEALRLDPDNRLARQGLKEAIKGKNPLYRAMLRYFLWMNKLQARGRWLVVIGFYLLYRLVIEVAQSNPELAPFLMPVIILYVLFAFSSWLASPISNLFLRLHPKGKHALDKEEKLASSLVGGSFGISLVLLISFFILGNRITSDLSIEGETAWILLPALYFGFMSLPLSGMFNTRQGGRNRKILVGATIVLAIAGLLGMLVSIDLFQAFFIGVLIYTFASGFFMEMDRRNF
ncbi:MAG: tetratricopeptide repeat protein [Bacteroidota bacterium]